MNQFNRLAIGTAQFGMDYGVANKTGIVCNKDVGLILDLCRLHGVNLIDTAVVYGLSETRLGAYDLKEFDVITKLPKLPKVCPNISEWVRGEILASMMRLGVPLLNGVLFHHSKDLCGPDASELYNAVTELKNDGLIKKIGISIYDPIEITFLLEKYKFDIVQAPVNIVDRRLVDSGLICQLKDLGIEVHARSIFLQGLLLTPLRGIPHQFRSWQFLWEAWHQWLESEKLSPLAACLAYSFSVKGIDRIILGIDSLGQFRQIIELLKKLPELHALPPVGSDCEDLINPSRWNS